MDMVCFAMKSLPLFSLRIQKLIVVLKNDVLRRALFKNYVLAAVEHRPVLNKSLKTIVDIGANRGQFALAARVYSGARVFSFEPLTGPAAIYQKVFHNDSSVKLYITAIGPHSGKNFMHVSAREDSSSLLEIGDAQINYFPGTQEIGTVEVMVKPLNELLEHEDIISPAMLKLDVQGFELEALQGCELLLDKFDWVYCECSFVELYSGQKLAADVIDWLSKKNFYIKKVFNPMYDSDSGIIQADILFQRKGTGERLDADSN